MSKEEKDNHFTRIRALCYQKNISLKDVATIIGMSNPRSIYNWNHKLPSDSTLEKVAEILDTTVDYIKYGNNSTLIRAPQIGDMAGDNVFIKWNDTYISKSDNENIKITLKEYFDQVTTQLKTDMKRSHVDWNAIISFNKGNDIHRPVIANLNSDNSFISLNDSYPSQIDFEKLKDIYSTYSLKKVEFSEDVNKQFGPHIVDLNNKYTYLNYSGVYPTNEIYNSIVSQIKEKYDKEE